MVMTQMQSWILEEMARLTRAERLAEAEQYRMVAAERRPSLPLRARLARALWMLADRLELEDRGAPRPGQQRGRELLGTSRG
jgi:hypothetical protein